MTARDVANQILRDIAAGRVPQRAWDEGREQRVAAAGDQAEIDRLFAEAGLAS